MLPILEGKYRLIGRRSTRSIDDVRLQRSSKKSFSPRISWMEQIKKPPLIRLIHRIPGPSSRCGHYLGARSVRIRQRTLLCRKLSPCPDRPPAQPVRKKAPGWRGRTGYSAPTVARWWTWENGWVRSTASPARSRSKIWRNWPTRKKSRVKSVSRLFTLLLSS